MPIPSSLKIQDVLGEKKHENWKKFKEELLQTGRKGAQELLDYLEKDTDMVEAPASSAFHNNFPGGLVDHSLNVLRWARHLREQLHLQIAEDSITLAALLHDICKVNYYIIAEVLDYEYKDKTDNWRKKEGYKVEEKAPLGHGDKSMMLVARMMPLTTIDELSAIRWHMGAWEHGVHSDPMISKPFRQALNDFPLVKLLIIADQTAELYETHREHGPIQESIFPD